MLLFSFIFLKLILYHKHRPIKYQIMGIEINPFGNKNDVLTCLPEIYSKNLEWFTYAPKFTTLRVNTIKYTVEQVAEAILQNLLEESAKLKLELPQVFAHNIVTDCLVVGPYKYLNDINVQPNGDVIVDVPCGNAVLRGAHIFAPGVLSLSTNVQEGNVVNIYVDLEGKCRRGFTKKFCGEKLLIGHGIVKIKRSSLFSNNAKLKGIAIEVVHRTSNVPSVTINPDYGILQNLPSIICGHVLELANDSLVLDMCASPGNKTTHIATLMKNMGQVIALDKSEQKIDKVTSLSNLLGLTNIRGYAWDSTKAVLEGDDGVGRKSIDEGPPFPKASFNRILLDAPCSALGHRPNLFNKITLKQLKSFICLQRSLFHNAVELLKPGGILVYSTCTVTIEENEDLVKWALNKYKDMNLVRAEPYLGSSALAGSGLTGEERSLVQRFDMAPGLTPESDTIGFFIAKFVKR